MVEWRNGISPLAERGRVQVAEAIGSVASLGFAAFIVRRDDRCRRISNTEALFVTFLLLHPSATYSALKEGVFATRQALDRDIA